MDSVSVWDDRAGLQSCWFECETYPTAAYKYPSSDADFLYLTGYRDEATRAEWYENVLFFSCLDGCRGQLKAQRWMYILVPSISAAVVFLLLICCLVCKGCPLARWCKESRAKSAKVNPKTTPAPNPFLVSMVDDSTAGLGYNQLGMAKDLNYGVYKSRSYRRRASTLDRKMHGMDSTYHNPTIPTAPPAAQYNPLEPGLSLTYSGNVMGGGQGAAAAGSAPIKEDGPIKRLATSTKRKVSSKLSRKDTSASSGKVKVARF